jgi:nondiscriminating aspartyl-tRNA synthetase
MITISGRRPFGEGIRHYDDESGHMTVDGFIHRIRDMGSFSFIIIRTARCLIQCVMEKGACAIEGLPEGRGLAEGDCVRVTGTKVTEPKAEGGFEVRVSGISALSCSNASPSLNISKKKIGASLEVLLENRPVALRHPLERAVFKLQEGIVESFRGFLRENGFTEIHTPKITSAGAEGGANIFRLHYFGRNACLAQSPQLYKQMMVGVFGRVFETGPVFRAEKHNTVRHLNEYVSLDFEMGFIDGMHDIMETETALLRHMMERLSSGYTHELSLLDVKLPVVGAIPCLKFREAKELIAREFGRKPSGHGDLDPEEEAMLCEYSASELNSEFIFITHFPSSRRPFYVMDDADDPGYAFSFDLLFRGLEITTGGQRIHDYEAQVRKMQEMGLNPSEFSDYLSIHKHGMPPHGGLGLGLERLTMQLLNLDNVRRASLFPRDTKRLNP